MLYSVLTEKTEGDDEEIKKILFKPEYRHHYWFIDIRYLVKIDRKWVYSICILEGYSRFILSGIVSLSKDVWEILIVLYSAIVRFGLPTSIVSDNDAVFTSHIFKNIGRRLDIKHKTIEKRKPWQNLIEAFFGIEARMTDYSMKNAKFVIEIREIHEKFINDYNNTDHWALRKRKDGRTTPSEAGSRPPLEG